MQIFMSSSLAVQYTALEILGEVIHIFHADSSGPPPELLGYYLDTRRIKEQNDDVEMHEEARAPSDERIVPKMQGEQQDENSRSKVAEVTGSDLPPVYFEDLDRAVVAAFNVSDD
jgi:hypothetical protein